MKLILRITFAAFIALTWSCGDDTADTGLADAWQLFVNGQYVQAHSAFVNRLNEDGSEAYVGLGWTTLKMDSLDASDRYFQRASADSLVHGYAGWAITSWLRGNYTGCISQGDFVLRHEADFEFEFNVDVNFQVIILAQAYSYFHLGNFTACVERIRQIDGSYAMPSSNVAAQLLTKLDQLNLQLL